MHFLPTLKRTKFLLSYVKAVLYSEPTMQCHVGPYFSSIHVCTGATNSSVSSNEHVESTDLYTPHLDMLGDLLLLRVLLERDTRLCQRVILSQSDESQTRRQ